MRDSRLLQRARARDSMRAMPKKKKIKEKKKPAKPAKKTKSKAKPKPQKISKDFQGLSVKQIAARVREHLLQAGYDPVLTGRACAAVYVGPKVAAKSLDFVLKEYEVPELADTMRAIGFNRSGLYTYEGKKSPLDVIFSPPPLAVGDDMIRNVDEIKVRGGSIKLLTPTDCTRQRLSMYYRWGDREAFEEAVEMALAFDVDMDLIKRWSDWEWCADRYEDFEKELNARKNTKL